MKKYLLLLAIIVCGAIKMMAQYPCNIYMKTQSVPFNYTIWPNRNVKLCIVNEHNDIAFDLLSYILRYQNQDVYDEKLDFCYVDLSSYLSLTERYRIEYQFNGFFYYKLRYNEPNFHINMVDMRGGNSLSELLSLPTTVSHYPSYLLHELNQSSGYTDYFTFEELGLSHIDYLGFEICLY